MLSKYDMLIFDSRDEAMRQTRRLQADILAEREKVKALMAMMA